MGFKRSPFPMIQGTKGHSSALTKQMKDLPLGSEERVSEYEKRKSKHDETTTGHDKYKERQAAAAKAETERTSVKTEGLGKKKGETYPSKFSAKQRARGAEVQRTKALKRRLEAEKPKSRFDEEGFPLEEVPLKFSKGGRVGKSHGGSVSTRLSSAGPVGKPN